MTLKNLLIAVHIHENLVLCDNTDLVHQRFNHILWDLKFSQHYWRLKYSGIWHYVHQIVIMVSCLTRFIII